MKKTLLAAALLAATSYATAATDVTLYGVLDAGVTVSKVHGGDTKVQMSNGNWMGNRWGIKGSEDLGSGNSVFFKLEQGYKATATKLPKEKPSAVKLLSVFLATGVQLLSAVLADCLLTAVHIPS